MVAIAKLKLELQNQNEWNDKENSTIVEIIAGHENELLYTSITYGFISHVIVCVVVGLPVNLLPLSMA